MNKYLIILILLCFGATPVLSQTGKEASKKPYVIENYYRIKWGHQQEFIDLYKKNHYPIVQKMIELGYITEVEGPLSRIWPTWSELKGRC